MYEGVPISSEWIRSVNEETGGLRCSEVIVDGQSCGQGWYYYYYTGIYYAMLGNG